MPHLGWSKDRNDSAGGEDIPAEPHPAMEDVGIKSVSGEVILTSLDPEQTNSRRRKLTDKGRDYQLKINDNNRKRLLQRLESRRRTIIETIELNDQFQTQEALQQYNDTAKLFEEAHNKYSQLLTPDECDADNEWFISIDEQICATKRLAYNHLRSLRDKDATQSRTSKQSHHSSNTFKSNLSRSSKHSVKSLAPSLSIKDQLVSERLRLAELQAENSFLEEKFTHTRKSKELHYKKEIAKSTARLDVLKNLDVNHTGEPYIPFTAPLPTLQSSNKKNIVPNLEPQVKEVVTDKLIQQAPKNDQPHTSKGSGKKQEAPVPEGEASTITQNRPIDQILCTMMRQQLAPEVDMEVYDGNPLNYNYFLATFKEVVENNIDDPRGRLTRLIKYTKGEAKDAIKHCIELPANEGYIKAMKLLQKRFGDPHFILAKYRNEIRNLPILQFSNQKGFREFLNLIIRCKSFVCDDWNGLDSPDTIQMLVSKLPLPLSDRWNRKVMILRQTTLREPRLADFVSFMEQETLLINDPLYSRDALGQGKTGYQLKQPVSRRKGIGTKALATTTNDNSPCELCDQSHDIENCPSFISKKVDERSAFVKEKKLCFGCFKPMSTKHNSRSCNDRRTCKICGKRHPTTLHGYRPKSREGTPSNDSHPKEPAPTSCMASSTGKVISMCTVPVKVYNPITRKSVVTLAMLDSCSQTTFVTNSLVKRLKMKGRPTNLSIKTINGEERKASTIIEGMIVECASSDLGSSQIKLPKAYTNDDLPVDAEEIATESKVKGWSYLQHISRYFASEEQPVDLLIGADCIKALEPLEFIKSQSNGPYAYRTKLGWCIVGPITKASRPSGAPTCNRIAVRDVCNNCIGKHHFEISTSIKDNEIPDMLERMYNGDFVENTDKLKISDAAFSEDEKQFMQLMDNNVQRSNGKYVLPLPFRSEATLPNNRIVAEKRLAHLKRKFMKDTQFFNHYKAFIDALIKGGHASKSTSPPPHGKTWYLPHHGVYSPNKPEKLRVVLDCGAKFKGLSLNHILLSGPDLTNQIVGVLSRFRQDQIGIMADIQSMFYQVFVPPEQRSFLRFLWWDDNDLSKSPTDYQMHVHVFGSTSSPSCANYALRRTALDNAKNYSPDVVDTLFSNFYVDDMLKSKSEEKESINFIRDVKNICSDGGFNLTKFVCNDSNVMSSFPAEDRGPAVRNIDFFENNVNATDRALGVGWNLLKDSFVFNVKLKEKPATRRGMLSTVSSIYDPLGFISPFVLKGRMILQQLCTMKLGWDDEVPLSIAEDWTEWKAMLPQVINDITICRCIKPSGFGKIVDYSMHHFSDASEKGYGQSSYLRLVNGNGSIHCTLIMGKSRVCPTKFVSIPRLELCAAVLSTKISSLINKEFRFSNIKEYFWTDSQVVLSYLKNRSKRFKTFVANRLEQIKSSTNVEDWHYIKSADNPADIASRGINTKDKSQHEIWFNGPSFLWQPQHSWKYIDTDASISNQDCEVKSAMVTATKPTKSNEIVNLVKRHSSWTVMRRIMAWVLRFIFNARTDCKRGHPLKVEEIEAGGHNIIQAVQAEVFSYEVKSLSTKQPLRPTSSIFSLDPFIGEDNLLRVGGRLKRSNLNEDTKHPILLPKNHRLSDVVITWCHQRTGHGGRGYTLNELRQAGFWVVCGNSVVRKIIYKCVTCRILRGILRGRTAEQKMSDLPKERMMSTPPFSYCGVDLFGPFIIKQRRTELKRYGVIFTCLCIRAVHLEVVNSLETDTFILALRRFIGRRGNIRLLRSDNGTNFVGTERELRKSIEDMDHKKIQTYLHELGADWEWKYNPPASSHMGGVWERQVRSIRTILSSLLKTHGSSLNDESLHTLMIEAEAIVNSRPLTVDTLSDATSPTPLAPVNLLTMKSKVVLPPPGEFPKEDVYSKKRWRRVQHLANEFWSRWKSEFLQSLQMRRKWNKDRRNFMVGDVVLLKDQTLVDVRNHWPMGRVVNVYVGDDGRVRSVDLYVGKMNTMYRRPISKLVLLVEGSNPDEEPSKNVSCVST